MKIDWERGSRFIAIAMGATFLATVGIRAATYSTLATPVTGKKLDSVGGQTIKRSTLRPVDDSLFSALGVRTPFAVTYVYRASCKYCEQIKSVVTEHLRTLSPDSSVSVIAVSPDSAAARELYWRKSGVRHTAQTERWTRVLTPLGTPTVVILDRPRKQIWKAQGADSVTALLSRMQTLSSLPRTLGTFVRQQEDYFAQNGAYAKDPKTVPVWALIAPAITSYDYVLRDGRGYQLSLVSRAHGKCTVIIPPADREVVCER